MTYRERREARVDRLEEWAEKREARAAEDLERARSMASVIPFGQPILAGHYSEGRDRNYRARIGSTYDRAFESAAKAESMAARAEGIRGQLDRSIYSDDPDAVEALEARIAELEAQRDRIKAENAAFRKAHGAELRAMSAYERNEAMPYPAYVLTNLTGNIKRNKDRLVVVRRRQERTEAAAEAGGVTVEERNGYAVVTFAEKPGRSTIDELKVAGFRWSGGSWVGSASALPAGIRDDHGAGCDGPANCVCDAGPLVGCDVEGCGARFFLVPERQFPTLCGEHADERSRMVDGWTPENSL